MYFIDYYSDHTITYVVSLKQKTKLNDSNVASSSCCVIDMSKASVQKKGSPMFEFDLYENKR